MVMRQWLAQALAWLQEAAEPNLLLAGDLNWADEDDGPLPLPSGWCAVSPPFPMLVPGYYYL